MSNFEDELRPDAEASRVISDEDLINIEIKELNKKIKDQGVSRELAIRLKQRRRTLKNRNYATSCREKKDAEISTLESERNHELDELRDLEQENQRIRERVETMQRQYSRIIDFARENNLDVRNEDLEYPFSPEERISD
ncbi:transcription factor MafK [Eurytemora carolleeae]|uniref:transcription factor MafK n=1 Tax=Eurytemora carolleeae TaxID=1294199 RepID=UPI000C78D623|nr:transcription factor MafK [Eurytemora carolleeae]|eukprot:XP_023333985.1 transcription factor MafK-like [Eurytemora affinis]